MGIIKMRGYGIQSIFNLVGRKKYNPRFFY